MRVPKILNAKMASVKRHIKSQAILQHLIDYANAVNALTWQRQGIFLSVAVLTGSFFSPFLAVIFFLACMLCEFVDLYLARKTLLIAPGNSRLTEKIFFGYVANTAVSALVLSIYAVWIGLVENGVGQFTALFCLFAAGLYAALNNHQIATALAIRLAFYSTSFLAITTRDIFVNHPPIGSKAWLPFFTVMFATYFLIDCSIGFLKMYRRDLKRLDDLKSEHEKTKAALILKSEFVAIVSHELRTPLTSIKGSLDLAMSGKFGEASSKIEYLLGMARKNTQRFTDLVNDLLDIQKLEDGKYKFDKRRVAISEFLAEALSCHQGFADRHKVQFLYDANMLGEIYVETDAARLMQVLANVLSNAAKFSPTGSNIMVGYISTDIHVRISVSDQGIGIPPAMEEQVFARFSQLDSTNQRKFGGTGLGLSISRDIIKALGGEISYTSELNVGTTFYIDIPVAGSLQNGIEPNIISDAANFQKPYVTA